MSQFIHGVEVLEKLDGTRPISSPRFSVAGLIGTAPDADADKFPLDTPVLVRTSAEATGLGSNGTLAKALDSFLTAGGGHVVIVRVEEGATLVESLANVSGDASAYSGVHAFRAAETVVGVTPRILAAPGWTHHRPSGTANPVIGELKAVCESLRAVAWADAPSNDPDAALLHASEIGSDRITPIYPAVIVFDTEEAGNRQRYPSAHFAGIEASLPFYESASNRPIAGIVGISSPVEHRPLDEQGQTNVLNAAGVATVIHTDGFRTWGNRGTGADPLTQFRSVRRVMDVVAFALEQAFDWAVDRNITDQLVRDIIGSVNAYLRDLRNRGAILGGEAFLNPTLNSQEKLRAGQVFIDFDIEPAAPLERLTFTMFRNGEYYEELVDQILESA